MISHSLTCLSTIQTRFTYHTKLGKLYPLSLGLGTLMMTHSCRNSSLCGHTSHPVVKGIKNTNLSHRSVFAQKLVILASKVQSIWILNLFQAQMWCHDASPHASQNFCCIIFNCKYLWPSETVKDSRSWKHELRINCLQFDYVLG